MKQDWSTGSLQDNELDSGPLLALADRIRTDPKINIHSILIVKKNALVFEEYFSGPDWSWATPLGVVDFDADTLHDVRSVTKSVVSGLVGIAAAEGRMLGLEASALDLFPNYREHMAPDKSALTLHNILTMTSGLDWFEPGDYSNPGNDEIRMSMSPDPIAFVLGRSLAMPPGGSFQYNGGLPTLLGYMLEEAYGKSGREIIKEKLFNPLGVETFEFLNNSRGTPAYASGLRLRPRDMAKIGLLYLQKGRWQGKQVIPEEWVEATLTSHARPEWTAGYGYQWWVSHFASDGASIVVPFASGNGGQQIYIIKDLDMVVVLTAGHYDTATSPLWGGQVLTDYVFPAAGLDGMKFKSGG